MTQAPTKPSIIDRLDVTLSNLSSPISFARTGSSAWPEWDRYLLVNGEPAIQLGNICGTCAFFFERTEESNVSVKVGELTSTLATGIDHITPEIIEALGQIMPPGPYHAVLISLTPHLTAVGSDTDYFAIEQVEQIGIDPLEHGPYNPRIDYYRVTPISGLAVSGDEGRIDLSFDFIIPLLPQSELDEERISFYVQRIEAGEQPTAVAISLLDVKQPEHDGVQDHRCMAHYVIDGHHKLAAAARTDKALTLLSFIAIDHGISNADDLHKYLELLS